MSYEKDAGSQITGTAAVLEMPLLNIFVLSTFGWRGTRATQQGILQQSSRPQVPNRTAKAMELVVVSNWKSPYHTMPEERGIVGFPIAAQCRNNSGMSTPHVC